MFFKFEKSLKILCKLLLKNNNNEQSIHARKRLSPRMPFPKSATGPPPPIGWYWSEKFDGYRAQWMYDDQEFYSRASKLFYSPDWFKNAMPPKYRIDGELWVGRENFEMMGVVRRKEPEDEDWIPVKFMAYDLPEIDKPFSERIKMLKKVVKDNETRWKIIRKKFPEPFNELDCPLVLALKRR